MKPLLCLCLLVGSLAVCRGGNADQGGITGEVKFLKKVNGSSCYELIATNKGPQPLRFCTATGFWRMNGAIVLPVGLYKTHPPSDEEVLASVKTLKPGESASIPFSFSLGAERTVFYGISEENAKKLNIWGGSLTCQLPPATE
ncbi:hypothetical protein [Luteolibacter sp. LG18]|uniref:hypothetical protein n=1 Tax=Luteolibacter sp. LG18 TaxID=2819286 RepID=UPI002B2A8A3C|nr:hypothetical protein llg_36020 [Luteolibacter sp. LG18]